jgi:hypothetical protein
MDKMEGIITRVFPRRGFAFVQGTDGFTRFIHCRDMVNPVDWDFMREGKGVKFIPIDTSDYPYATGNKMRAIQVEVI